MHPLCQKPLTHLVSVGEKDALLLKEEAGLATLEALLLYYPFRYEDRRHNSQIANIVAADKEMRCCGQLGTLSHVRGRGGRSILKGMLCDGTGTLQLVWFNKIRTLEALLKRGITYDVYGTISTYQGKLTMIHPEMQLATEVKKEKEKTLYPIYRSTQQMRKRYWDSKRIAKLVKAVLEELLPQLSERLPAQLCATYRLLSRREALRYIHFPPSTAHLHQAQRRLKFEELFYLQLRLRHQREREQVDVTTPAYTDTSGAKDFIAHHLPFALTNAQQRVLHKIFEALASGKQMNQLLQGDVGSGKTIVALLSMFPIWAKGAQVAFMAPTTILAEQHYASLDRYLSLLPVKRTLLTGATTAKERKGIYAGIADGSIQLIVGTHSLIQESVAFHRLGLAIIDEQHRFGVAQRAKLWSKSPKVPPPHLLMMTATPIPRTLAMTLYGDAQVLVIDELPAGRLPIKTYHATDANRLRLMGFMGKQLDAGQQIYVVYPLVEENRRSPYKDVLDGYESMSRAFGKSKVGILYGKMKPADKVYEMERFARGETKIMVATTVIEVGVDVANATLMIIENADRFGLSQLHQLRGRVGRGGQQSYCILVTGSTSSKVAGERWRCGGRRGKGLCGDQVQDGSP